MPLPPPTADRFNDRVENYAKFRPGYPVDVLDVAVNELGLCAHHSIADIGSGTGIFSRLLLSRGNRVYGVEPNAGMREVAEANLSGTKNFISVAGTAEATTLPAASVDLVTAAQAFHWFDLQSTRREFARILRPHGWVMLVWNERLSSGTPFREELESLLLRRGTDYHLIAERTLALDAALPDFFDAGTLQKREFPSNQLLDESALLGRILSSSFVPLAGQPGHAELVNELRQLFARHAQRGEVVLEYSTNVYFGRVTAR